MISLKDARDEPDSTNADSVWLPFYKAEQFYQFSVLLEHQ